MPVRRFIISVFLLSLSGLAAVTAADYYADDLTVFNAGVESAGGYYPAGAEGFAVLFSNPAGLRSVEAELAVSQLDLQLSGPIFDIANLVIEGTTSGDIAGLISEPATQALLKSLDAGLTMAGPIYFGFVGEGLGFGLFNQTDIGFKGNASAVLTANLEEQILLLGGYAHRFYLDDTGDHALDAGLMLKGGVEGRVEIQKAFLELPGLITSFDSSLLMTSPYDFIISVGCDLGLQYTWTDFLSLGLTAMDLYTPTFKSSYSGGLTDFLASGSVTTSNGIVPLSLNFGARVSPDFAFLEFILSDLDFLIAYTDILDIWVYPGVARFPLLNLKLAIRMTMLDILDVQVALRDGLPSAGFGLDLTWFRMNFAMYGTENSVHPGLNPVYNLALGFEFRV